MTHGPLTRVRVETLSCCVDVIGTTTQPPVLQSRRLTESSTGSSWSWTNLPAIPSISSPIVSAERCPWLWTIVIRAVLQRVPHHIGTVQMDSKLFQQFQLPKPMSLPPITSEDRQGLCSGDDRCRDPPYSCNLGLRLDINKPELRPHRRRVLQPQSTGGPWRHPSGFCPTKKAGTVTSSYKRFIVSLLPSKQTNASKTRTVGLIAYLPGTVSSLRTAGPLWLCSWTPGVSVVVVRIRESHQPHGPVLCGGRSLGTVD